jgi:hypothetical protein
MRSGQRHTPCRQNGASLRDRVEGGRQVQATPLLSLCHHRSYVRNKSGLYHSQDHESNPVSLSKQ